MIKGSILDGKLLDASDTLKLADLESREELLARLAGMFEAVLAQPARLALASLSKAARLLAAYQAKREEAGETVEPAPAADDTPVPDSPAAEAVTEQAEADPEVNATPEDAEPVSKPGASDEAQ